MAGFCEFLVGGTTLAHYRALRSLQPDLRRVPSVQSAERVPSQGHFVPLLARAGGTRVTLPR